MIIGTGLRQEYISTAEQGSECVRVQLSLRLLKSEQQNGTRLELGETQSIYERAEPNFTTAVVNHMISAFSAG